MVRFWGRIYSIRNIKSWVSNYVSKETVKQIERKSGKQNVPSNHDDYFASA